MSLIDQFESVFRAASKPVYRPTPRRFEAVLLLTDLPRAEAEAYGAQARELVKSARGLGDAPWTISEGSATASIGDLLTLVEQTQPDLVVAYRNLHTDNWQWPYTLGDHVVVVTQVTQVPVLLLPRPERLDPARGTDRVMAVTDHLAGEAALVDAAVAFTPSGGTLHLAHVEDDAVLARYVDFLSKLPNVPTDEAEKGLRERMLKEPRDYITSVQAALKDVDLTVQPEVRMGHRLSTWHQLVAQHHTDLLVLNTKDEDQHAMHGLAYPLAVELRDLPLLML